MFGTRPSVPKPVLLLIVYGIFLVIVGVTAVSQSVLVSIHFSSASLEAAVGSDAATVRTFVNGFLTPADLNGQASDADMAVVEAGLAAIAHRAEIVRIEIISPSGRILASNERTIRGQTAPVSAGLTKARTDQTVDASIVADGAPTEAVGPSLGTPQLLRAYFPLIGSDGTTQAVVAIWRDAAPLFARLDEVRRDIVLVTVSAAVIISVFLYLIFRSAQRRIIRQTLQLVESTRRDPLTGLLNHGALVAELALAIEQARTHTGVIGVVLVDLDNFRALNDGYGHDSGDLRARAARGQPPGSPAGSGDLRPLRSGRVSGHRPGRADCRARADGRWHPRPAVRPESRDREPGADADHDQRRDRRLPGARLLGDGAPLDGRDHAGRSQGKRR